MNYLNDNYSNHPISLDVSTDNLSAVSFYRRSGLKIQDIYLSQPDLVEFALFETPLDKNGKRLSCDDPQLNDKSV